MQHIMILWSAHCDMWSAWSSRFNIAAHVSQNASFLYIIILCQFWLVELSRFQYYLNCDHTFVLFDFIESYICKISLLLSQLISELHLWLIELYSSCYEVKNSSVNLLCSMSRNLLQSLKSSFNMTVFAHQHNDYSWEWQWQCHQCRQWQQHVYC